MLLNLDELTKRAIEVRNTLFDLKGKNALIVGGNKGIGQAMALGLAGAGANVCVVGRGPAGLDETAEAVREIGSIGAYFAADVTVEDQVKEMVAYNVEKFGKIDILINSQGLNYLQEATNFD
ncbi:MAG: SDR family NAD(P)-dependent oxidoreductase, partial [Atribacterota bacterium]|nr:SDR family NAD(P)-dependent oxidoreductase [Atribacterota bacterium]